MAKHQEGLAKVDAYVNETTEILKRASISMSPGAFTSLCVKVQATARTLAADVCRTARINNKIAREFNTGVFDSFSKH